MRAASIAAALASLGLILMSLWPGFAGGCFVLLAIPAAVLLGIVWLLLASRALPRPWGRSESRPWRQIVVAPVLVFQIPRRVAFLILQGQFESCVQGAPVSQYGGAKLDRWMGIYHVDEYAADPRGGVYFRTGTGPDGIGPDLMSYGFAFRPNRQGTPFGAAHHQIRRIAGEWYWFSASDDWH